MAAPEYIMATRNFEITRELISSDNLTNEAMRRGVGATAIMRDFVVVQEFPDATTVAVGDMANNLVGDKEHVMPKLAKHIGYQDLEQPLNGGLIGSYQLRDELARPEFDDTGHALIARANRALERTYEKLKMPGLFEGRYVDPATLFTGYLTHARIADDVTTITSVGDVYAWINGELVAGSEKPVDTHKEALVNKLTGIVVDVTAELDFASIEESVREFAAQGKMPGNVTEDLLEALSERIKIDSGSAALDRQTVYRPVDDVVTPWQIRSLQNHPATAERLWAYGAIDGRLTPDTYVTVREFPTSDIDNLVIATDGSTPRREDGKVRSLGDLGPVNPQYSERGMLALHRR